jgi:hypothetical protein
MHPTAPEGKAHDQSDGRIAGLAPAATSLQVEIALLIFGNRGGWKLSSSILIEVRHYADFNHN